MDNCQSWIEVVLQKNHENNTIAKILTVDTNLATKKGDNYLSEIKRIKMEIMLKSGKKTRKSVIVKGLPPTEYHQEFMKELSIFTREITMYRDVISNMEDVLKEFGDCTEPMWAKMIDYRANDLLVMDDLAEYGFKMGSRKDGFDLDHCLLVVQSLAKFHATSVIVKERGFIPMDVFQKHIFETEASKQMMEDYYTQSLNNLIKQMETNWEPEWKPLAEKLKENILPRAFELVLKKLSYNRNKFSVMNHGDCWVNNMLFKYGVDSIKPISMKFVDLQISFYNSPVFDLQYFLNSSPNLEVRTNSLYKVLQAYHDMLVKQLELYQYKGLVLTYDELLSDFKDNNIFGLMTAVTLLPIVYRDESDESFPEIEDFVKDMKNNEKPTLPGCESPQYAAVMKVILARMDRDNSFS